MGAINSFITCPDDCADQNLWPATPETQDCPDYEQDNSQIHTLYMIPVEASDIFSSWSSTPAVVADTLDNTQADNSTAKFIVGEGALPAAEKITLDYPFQQTKVVERTYNITFNVKNLVATQYEFLRKVQCGTLNFTFYYASGFGPNNWVYGKEGGITPSMVDVDFPKGGGKDDRDMAVITLQFKAKGDPDRKVNPYA